jgi:hypothetical protein
MHEMRFSRKIDGASGYLIRRFSECSLAIRRAPAAFLREIMPRAGAD